VVSVTKPSTDLFAVGRETNVHAEVLDNAVLLGLTVRTSGDARIGGDLMTAGRHITLSGPIDGDVYAVGGAITLEEGAVVSGDMWAWGDEVHLLGEVRGEIEISEARPESGRWVWARTVLDLVRRAAAAFATGLVAMWLLGTVARRPSALLRQRPGAAAGLGFAVTLALPVVLIVTLFTVVGIPVALIGFGLYAAGLYLATPVVAYSIAGAAFDRWRPRTSRVIVLGAGVSLLTVLGAVPWLGTVVVAVVVIAGMGGLALACASSDG